MMDNLYLLHLLISSGDLARMSGKAFKAFATIMMYSDDQIGRDKRAASFDFVSYCAGLDRLSTGQAVKELLELRMVQTWEDEGVTYFSLADKKREIAFLKDAIRAGQQADGHFNVKH